MIGPTGAQLKVQPAALERLLVGRIPEEVAERLPRLFNLCRQAQAQAARLALGLPGQGEDVASEVIRDHQAKVFVTLRQAFNLAPMAPRAFVALPGDAGALAAWMAGPSPEAELARAIDALFPPGIAVVPALAYPIGVAALSDVPYENSAAGRQAQDPLLAGVEAVRGRGPLWRYLGLLVDARAAMQGRLPAALVEDGVAVVQAARGAYALRIGQQDGVVTGIERRTPTDQQLAPGGPLERALAALPADKLALAPLVLAVHDPCIPVAVTGIAAPDRAG